MNNEGVEMQNQNQENQNVKGQIGQEQNIVAQPAVIGNAAGKAEAERKALELEKSILSLEGRSQVLLKNKNDQHNIYFIILGALITAVAQILSSPSPNCKLVSFCFIPLFTLAFLLIGIPLIHTAGEYAGVKIECDSRILLREKQRDEPDIAEIPRDTYREWRHKCWMATAAIILVIFNILVIVFMVKFCKDDKHACADAGCVRVCNKICAAD